MADPASGEGSGGKPEVQKYRPRACQACARSKMKCEWPEEPGATPCTRCAKIRKTCALPEFSARKRRGPSSRVGQLEEKLDGIMSLLHASKQINQNSPDSGDGPASPGSPGAGGAGAPGFEQGRNSIHQLLNPNMDVEAGAGSRATEGFGAAVSSPPSSSTFQSHARFRSLAPSGPIPGGPSATAASMSHSPTAETTAFAPVPDMRPPAGDEPPGIQISPGFAVSFLEADRRLNLFRSMYSPYFPFVTIPALTTPHDLLQTAPFLLRTILAITTPQSPAVQAGFKLWFREWVAQHVVVNMEKRLEILQAVLIYLAWGDFHFMLDSQATTLIQLANALVIDLGLNRWPLDYGRANFIMLREASGALNNKVEGWKKEHTHDEMRAALGTFYTTSLCSTLFRRQAPMIFNPYLLKCCDRLAEADECDSDKFLVALVRIQQILNRTADIIPYVGGGDAARRVQYTPIHMALTAAQKELEALTSHQPPEVKDNALLWTHHHGTICRLYEPVLYIRPTPSYDAHDPTARSTALMTSLTAARDFLTTLAAIPRHSLPCVPFQAAHLSFCTVTAARLLLHSDDDDPDWNAAVARDAVGFADLLARVGDAFDGADQMASGPAGEFRVRYTERDGRTVLGAYRDKVRWVRDWYLARTRLGGQAQGNYRGGGAGGGEAGDGVDVKEQEVGGGGMEVDYNAMQQAQDAGGGVLPGAMLDEGFWTAMFDWSWTASGSGLGPVDFGGQGG